jgi:hypothetical protein
MDLPAGLNIGGAASLVLPVGVNVGDQFRVDGTDCVLECVKYSAATSVAVVVGVPLGLNTTQSGTTQTIANTLSETGRSVSTDISISANARFRGMSLNTTSASTGGFGLALVEGHLSWLNSALGLSLTAKITASVAANTRMNWVADSKFAACSTGTKGSSTAVAMVETATAAATSTPNIIILGYK